MLLFSTNLDIVNVTKSFISKFFDMKDFGEVDVIISTEVTRAKQGISLNQSHYVETILQSLVNLIVL